MFDFQETLQAMRAQRASLKQELDRLDRAISALQSVVGHPAPARVTAKPVAQLKVKQGQSSNEKKAKAKSKISAQGLRNIVEAQKKRWAKVRAAANAKKAKAGPGK